MKAKMILIGAAWGARQLDLGDSFGIAWVLLQPKWSNWPLHQQTESLRDKDLPSICTGSESVLSVSEGQNGNSG